jgi:hypothetical protein
MSVVSWNSRGEEVFAQCLLNVAFPILNTTNKYQTNSMTGFSFHRANTNRKESLFFIFKSPVLFMDYP